jgi:hypothetical protein
MASSTAVKLFFLLVYPFAALFYLATNQRGLYHSLNYLLRELL